MPGHHPYTVQAPTVWPDLNHSTTLTTRDGGLPYSAPPMAVELNCSLRKKKWKGNGEEKEKQFLSEK